MSVTQRDKYERELMSKENLEREKFFASGSMSDVTPYDLLQPRSDFALRNRYLSRIGAKVSAIFKSKIVQLLILALTVRTTKCILKIFVLFFIQFSKLC